MNTLEDSIAIENIGETLETLRCRLNSVLLGKAEAVDLVVACLLAKGHLLMDDLPGTGKTTLAKAIAACVGGKLARVQCTPDLLPSDVTGFNLFNQKTREFEFHAGPVFSDVLLADELNRTTPRTQSALLEAMAERQVTIDAVPYTLSKTFFVIATQNPIDSHGAYPLPEAQLDRFSIKLKIGYPDRASQIDILEAASRAQGSHEGSAVALSLNELANIQEQVRTISVHPRVREYLVDLVEATRENPAIQLGVSPRGMLLWQRMAQAWAMLQGRDFVTPSDVLHVARPLLSVRLLTTNDDVDAVIDCLLDTVPAPEYR
ncbi:ATPase family associated with various cellular activities (AAA) [Rubripirellula amarantea]|uniref:ATPase family associated with various cellular activities (AAA) n=1 Tax=Rubripirellula amarantea TaxID=2527999 RepID=A0A5C5WLR1_9BACT|nr:MoxR family ATPase [Rubripirellula amarantea]TWT50923.1 ATPase family associated with various cellular activities (AAA) [Rubripirellula amarantea]